MQRPWRGVAGLIAVAGGCYLISVPVRDWLNRNGVSSSGEGYGPSPKVVFSDIDGTLAHYDYQLGEGARIIMAPGGLGGVALVRYPALGEERLCRILRSSRSGQSYISFRTLELITALRDRGVLFGLITGARSSTYLQRRPHLPAVDFEVFENGGRMWIGGRPDPGWSRRLLTITGFNDSIRAGTDTRPEPLWEEYRLLESNGWAVDAKDYETEFRMSVRPEDERRFKAEVVPRLSRRGLAYTINLGKVDILPRASGKANAARYILGLIGVDPRDAAALFDDANDLELGDVCGTCLLPAVSHESVRQKLSKRPRWRVMPHGGPLGTEAALEELLAMLPPLGAQAGELAAAAEEVRQQL